MTERVPSAALAACVCFLTITLSSATATADKQKSLEIFDRATESYKTGDYDAAVELYVEAYEVHPAPEYLFNIAQAHRKLEHCEQALHYYRLYLSVTKNARGRLVAEKHIAALSPKCSPGTAATGNVPPPVPPPLGNGPAIAAKNRAPPAPRRFATVAQLGPAFYDIGDVDVNLRLGLRVGAAFVVPIGAVNFELGVTAEYSAMPYDFDDEGTASLVSVIANVGAAYALTSRLHLRAELGLGDQAFVGLSEGNPFSAGAQKTGALHMLTVRAAVGIDYWITPGLAVHGSPVVYGFSRRNDRLASDIRSIRKFGVLAGFSYAL